MEQTLDQMRFITHFIHHEKTVQASEEICATLLGYDLELFRKIKSEFAGSVQGAAADLVADPGFVDAVKRLPFSPGAVVVCLGDSITDDYTSWCEILREVLARVRPEDAIQIVNEGVSGDTSTEVIARFLNVVNHNPDWVIIMLGTNDARMHGLHPAKTMVSLEETSKNYQAFRAFAQDQTHARLCWMTPTPVIPEKIAAHWYMSENQLMWSNDDLRQRAALLAHMPDPVVDLFAAFQPVDPSLLLEDGLHPSLAGQQVILRALVDRLAIY